MKRLLAVIFSMVFLMGWFAFSDAAMCGKGMGDMDEGMGMGMGAGMEGMHMGMAGEHPMMGKLMSLGLDEKQMAEIKDIHFKCRKEAIKKKADIEVAEMELSEILGKDPVDLTAAEAKIKQIEALKADMKMQHIKSIEDIKGKLTPEQKKKFHSMMATMRMGGRMGMMGGMMGGGMGMTGGKCGKCGMMKDMGHSDDDDSGNPSESPASPEPEHQHQH